MNEKIAVDIASGIMRDLAQSGMELDSSSECQCKCDGECKEKKKKVKGSEEIIMEVLAASSPLQIIPEFLKRVKNNLSSITKEDVKGYLEDSGFDVKKLETVLKFLKKPEWLGELSQAQYESERSR